MSNQPAFLPALPLRVRSSSIHFSQRQTFQRFQCSLNRPSSAPLLPPAPVSTPVSAPVSAPESPPEKKSFETRLKPLLPRLLRLVSLLPLLRLLPAHAAVTATAANAATSALALDPSSFASGLTASFILVLASEIGDKTFFISALLSMKYSRALVLLGTMLALGAMTFISVGIGQLFHTLPTSLKLSFPIDDYAAVAALVWFGIQSIRDGLAMSPTAEEELQDARDVVAGKSKGVRGALVVAETSSLVFLAEWGDKSMLATVALAAAKSPIGVIVGGISGHFVASIIAVLSGSLLGKFVSERTARLIGGALFLVFAVLTVYGIYYPS